MDRYEAQQHRSFGMNFGRMRLTAGSAANSGGRVKIAVIVARCCLCSDTEQSVDELSLADYVALAEPADLTLSDCMHCLITFDCSPRAFRRTEAKAGGDALLEEAIVSPAESTP